MKISKRSRWMILFALLTVLVGLILSGVKAVRATVSDMHMISVLLRVESEVMQKTPAGQYYEALMWKHTAEINQIISAHPENNERIISTLRLFTPGLEALVEGEGDTVHITSEQVHAIQEQLNFFVSVGSPAFRDDIEKERQRLQLERFVGLTMNDAWDLINSTWTPDSVELPLLVPGSDGKWAYYVHDGVYLEYPINFRVQASAIEMDRVYFVPSSDSPELWNPCTILVKFIRVSPEEKDKYNPRGRYSPETVPWESEIGNTIFPGIEFIVRQADWIAMNLRAYQYNEEHQIAVEFWAFVYENPQLADSTAYAEMVDERYEYFQHMVKSLRIEPQ